MVIQGIPLREIHALALISYSQRPLGVTCPIFSDDAFYVEAGIHHGIAAVQLEFFDGDDSVEAAILSQLKLQHKGENPFFSRLAKLLLIMFYCISEELPAYLTFLAPQLLSHMTISILFTLAPGNFSPYPL